MLVNTRDQARFGYLFLRNGKYNEALKIRGDWAFTVREIILNNCSLRELPITMLVSSHDLHMVAELFPRMVVMDEGLIVADGDTQALMADEELLHTHGLERP